jgi:amino acid adenylation domain-containing protein
MSDTKNQNLEQLRRAVLLQRLQQRGGKPPEVHSQSSIARADRNQRLPLSLAQQRLWFLDQLDKSASTAYQLSAALRLIGKLDVDALQATLDRVVARHESLRTHFGAVDGVPYQQIGPGNAGFTLRREDLRGMPVEEREAAVAALAAEEARTPFELSAGPLIRGRLLAISEDVHVLLITQHHIVTDGWSLSILVREVAALYTAFRRGEADPLPPLEIQYADYAQWQRGWLQGEELARQIEFWRGHLSGAPALLNLPLDRPRPAVQTHAGGAVPFTLSPSLTAGLQAFSQRHGVTLFMTLLSAWGLLLSRLSGQQDVVVGTSVANRQRRQVEGLIGFFVNTLALRLRFDEQPAVASLLAQVKETMLAAFSHQELPFEQVVEAVQPQRSLSHSPLFQSLFSLNNTPDAGVLDLPEVKLEPVERAADSTHFDLSLSLRVIADRLEGALGYASALFDRETVARWAGHYERLLEAMVADASMTVDALPLLSNDQQQAMLQLAQGESADRGRETLLPRQIEQQAVRTPSAIALRSGARSVSYAEFNARANRLAHWLIERGIGRGARVGVHMGRSIELLIAKLAVMKTGAAYVPLDPAQQSERMASIVRDAGIGIVLSAQAESLWPDVQVVTVGGDAEWLNEYSDRDPAVALNADDTIYVLYTSGSTGEPKGVDVHHGGVIDYCAFARRNYYGGHLQGSLVATSPAFDLTLPALYVPLLAGGCVELLPEEEELEALTGWLADDAAAVLLRLTPSHVQALLTLSDDAPRKAAHVFVIGGEVFEPALARRLQTRFPASRIYNHYGPTETVVGCAWFDVTANLDALGARIPIGRPMENTALYVLDAKGRPQPPGVPGELYIGGAGVTKGYLNRADLTAEKFVVNPFGAAFGQTRVYRSGDQARWLANGHLEFLGRVDRQVKLRGFRIELGEIESRLKQSDGVREAVVRLWGEADAAQLVAYVVAAGSDELDAQQAALHAQLSAQLPSYMLPAAYVWLDELPLTVNGKVDLQALPAPDLSALRTREYEAPQGEIEETMAELWQSLLRVERVSRHDNFFELGGHSLLGVQVVSRLRQALNVELPLRALFATPTLSALAAVVRAAGASTMGRILPADRSQPLPLSLAQQRLWFLDQLDKAASAAYHMPAALRLAGKLDTSALKTTLDRLVARHESLRTYFVAIDGVPYQQVASSDCGFALSHEDLTGLSAEEREEAVAALAAEEARAAFDLSTGPLIRGRLLKLSDEEHVLLLTQHHIVSDGWSLGILVREVAALYAAFHNGKADPLPPLEIQYADYAQWQRSWLQGEELARQLDFWKDHLAGAPALLNLPLDRPRPAVQSHAGGAVPLMLSPELTANLRAFAQRHGVTPFMTLLSGWGLLLARLSGQQEVVIGTPVANRQRRETEELIGFFVNTLAMRLRFDEQPTVEALLGQVKETTLAAFAHQELPFEQVVEAVQPQRSMSHSPLFQTMLAFSNARGRGTLDLPELTLTPVERVSATTHFELSAALTDQGTVIGGVLEYAGDLFDRATIERWAGYYVRLLEAMVVDATAGIEKLSLLPASERQQLLAGFNATAVAYPNDELIHELVEQQAAAHPDAVAVIFEDRSLTYAELNAQANQLAHELLDLGVRPDDRVAICVERSFDMVIGVLGILKAGGAYLPLDPAYPHERLEYMLRDGAPKALLTEDALLRQLPAAGLPALLLDSEELRARLSARPVSNPSPRELGLTAQHLAYVIYTSGSTGVPKGVAMPQSALQNLLHWQERDDTPGQFRTVQYSALGFDVAFQEIFSTLGTGGSLVLLREEVRRDPAALLAFLRDARVHRLFLPFVALNSLAEAASRSSEGLPSLRHVITAGEQLVMTPAVRALLAGAPDCRLHNHYGPTETHVVTAFTQSQARNDWPELPPIGRPIANSAIYILDAQREPVPLGVTGEIYIGGAGVARGYLNRPELTAERFLRDPFRTDPHARMYKTGDLGRWLPDGNIDYLGRNDFQLKIRGFRIELGEIEAKLSACAGVREAVVIAREEVAGDKRLVAYVVADEGVALPAAELRAALLSKLPEYMVPSAFVQLEAMPLSSNGKLDRKALPAPDASALSMREYEAPQDGIEEKLAAVWQELLRVERVGRHDNFFELGGHSLLAVQLISRVRMVMGVDIALREVFVQPSLHAFAEVVGAAKASTMGTIERADRSGFLPLSLAQQRLWFLDQLDKAASAAYHLSAALRLLGKLDVAALQATLDRVIARHEGLRTRFVLCDGEPGQEIARADCGFALKRGDLRQLSAVEREAVVARVTAQEARAPFDLSAGPLIRGQLLTVADDEHVLLITQHHIVSDGWSLNILVREVAALYTAFRRGEADPLPPLEIQYADYAQWQRGWLQGDELARQLDFWKNHLAGAPAVLNLPLDRPRPAVQSHAGGAVPFRLSPELTARLQAFSQRHGATLFMTLLSAWGVLLCRLSGQQEVVVGTSVANRQRREVEGLIGFFINTLALRLRLDQQPTVASLLAQVKETTLAAFANQELPFEQVVEAVQPQRSLSHSPLFQSMFAFNNTPDAGVVELPELSLAPVERAHDTTHFDLSLSVSVRGERLEGGLGYVSALFDRETIERWAAYYEHLLEAMVADTTASVETLPLLSAGQEQALRQQSSGPVNGTGRDRLLPQQIAQQAMSTPDAIALRSGTRSLSYSDLNARANRLAHFLLAQGVSRGARVGVQLGRSVELLIGNLAVMKTGAAYVPLDIRQQDERLSSIVRDANIEIVLSAQAENRWSDLHSVALGGDSEWLNEYSDREPDVALSADDTIYVLYTSGSTGEPKGVEVHHGGVIDYCAFARANYYGHQLQGSLVATSPAFDLTLPALYVPLLAGGCVELLAEEDELEALSHWLADDSAAVLLRLTPSHVQALLTLSDTAPRNAAHVFVVGGEVFEPALARQLQAKFPAGRIYNHYGPTETVVGCAWFDISANLDALHARIPIGRPMENTALYVVGAKGQLQPPGVPGELYIGGAGVAKGYLNRPELTAEKFVTFNETRVYRSGDQVRWRTDGQLEFIGRVDRQVKLRGFRIELGEIESRLKQSEHVREGVVRLWGEAADAQLVAYAVTSDADGGSQEERQRAVHARLSSLLPSYMLPAAYVWLDALPLTVNGKVDLNALPAPDLAALRSREYEAPQGPLEETMAGLWQTLLRVERVGRHDNFFELGGHSLLVVSLVGRLRERGLSLPVRDVFVEPTLQALAARVAALEVTSDSELPSQLIGADCARITPDLLPLVELSQAEIDTVVGSVPGGVANVQDIYGLSPLQEGILFHHLLQEKGDAYLTRRVLAFASRDRLEAFLTALQNVIDRHDSLRTAFRWQDLTRPVQVVYRNAQLAVTEQSFQAPVLPHLLDATDPRQRRSDLTQAPLIAAHVAGEPDGRFYLALLTHHLITDHLSTELLIVEIDAFLAGRGSALLPPLPYRKFIAQSRRTPAEQHEAYFRVELVGLDQPSIPFGITETLGSGAAIAETRQALPEELAQRIHDAARRERLSPAVLFHAAWALLVGGLSGRDDAVFGSVLSGRQGLRGGERAIGMFMNTLPLRLRLDGRGVQQVIRETAAQLAGLLDHEQAPLALAQRASGIRAPWPLFTALFNYRHSSAATDRHIAAMTDGIELLEAGERNNYPLTMSVGDLGRDFVLTSLTVPGIDGELICRSLQSVLCAMVDKLEHEPQYPFHRLPLLAESDRRELLYAFNDTGTDYPAAALIHELFEQQAAAQPDAVAVVFAERRLTYGELNTRANQLAHSLIALGIQPGDRVAICMERSPEMVVGLLGVLKAGGAYLPLDPAYPAERLSYMLQDGAPKALLTQQALQQALQAIPGVAIPVLRLDSDELRQELAARPAGNPDARAHGLTSGDLAYVIYTSGSTGTPKGVAVPHRAATNYFAFAARQYLAGIAGAVVSSPLTFDATLTTLVVPLLAGRFCRLLAEDNHESLVQLLAGFRETEPLLFKLTPAHLELLANLAERPVSGVRHRVVVGGEQLSRHVLRKFAERVLPDAVVVNEYGPTETVVGCTTYECSAHDPDASGMAVPIGKPIANTQIYILNAHREPVPAGVEGEIYIGGAGVAHGYLNRPELTAERFVSDPFRSEADARMYKTGDLARRLPDGNLEYLGRNDFQVKIRGFRIELGEVEAKLSACPGVREAAVLAREDVPGDRRLVAYVVAQDGASLPPAELRAVLSGQLPDYMVPSAFVTLEAMPLTANGKLDRKALPAPEATALSVREYEAPQDEIETTLAALWQELLHVDRAGRHDNFFELGGHSLLAVQVVSRLRSALGVELPLRELFTKPSLSALADAVRNAGRSTLGGIPRAERDQPLPLSLAQQRLWFLDRLDKSASAVYHMPIALRLRGELDVPALQSTLDRLVARHESLRTRFVEIDGVPYQQIAPADCGFALRHETCTEGAVAALAAEEAAAPFDLSTGPMVRGRLLALAAGEHVLLITQHHIVSDGVSLNVMVREVAALYTAFHRGEPDPLPPLEIQYADYAQWQRQWLQGPELARQSDFWKEQLAGAPALLGLPLDRSRPAVQSHVGGRVPFLLSPELTAGVRALSRRHGVTPFMTLFSAWGLLLSRLSGQTDVVIGTSVANRQRREVENLIGFFVNTLALRLRLDGKPSVESLLEQAKETTLAAFAHQELPFEQVVEAVQPQRSLSHSPLFQSMFAFNNTSTMGENVLALPGLTLAPVKSTGDSAHFDLSLSMADGEGHLAGALEYASDLFDRATVERWTGYFVHVLEAMVADASAAVDTLPMLPAAERRQLLHEFNAAEETDTNERLVHELFEQQAAMHPDAVAVVFEEQRLTYGALNARANQLAHHLIALGIQRDDRVAIAVERSLDLVVGVLGILKAGGAYLPLDPAYPAERLQSMLQDGAPKALLTQQALQQTMPATAVPALLLDSEELQAALSAQPAGNPDARVTSSHLAYVIYTSGSTGTPKGVMVEHHNASNMAQAHAERFHVGSGSRVLQFVSLAFDVCAAELFMTLTHGASLHLAPRERLLPGEPLQTTLRDLAITHALLPVGVAALCEPELLPDLRYLIVGGDVCPPALTRRRHEALQFFNAYGPTEATVCASVQRCDGEYQEMVPIGRPFANARLYILDANRELVPVGVEGEIYIGGAGVARGYLNRPELTAERFVNDPFRADAGARMYKTGDLGRWLPDGRIEYSGRNDFQVKIRGFRIELGEIEAKLSACDGVAEAAVIAREDAAGDKRLVAYLVASDGAGLQAPELRAVLSAQLPDYMVPSAFVMLDALPLTANGKLDRKALPAPEATALSAREYEAPQDEIELTLATIWQELLHVERVGRHDNFFELGGHSLLAVQLVSRLRSALNVELPLRELFASPTLSALGGAVRAAGASTMGRILAADRNQPLPLSLAQQRLWFLDRLDKAASAAYHMPAALRLLGELDRSALQSTLDRLIARHESLRTHFVANDGVPYQQIAPADCGFALRHEDWSALPVDEREAVVAALAAEEAAAAFDLSAGPLIRGRLLKLAADEHVLLITQHHIVSDGWSINVLVREVAALYTAFRLGEPDPLPALEVQYADYAQWQRHWLQGGELARQSDFWKEHLSGAPALLSLPLDRPRPAIQSHAGGRLPFMVPAELTAGLRMLSQRHGVTLFMTLLSAWGVLLSRLSGQTDVVIGTSVANRQRREIENLIGFFVNTLALRLRIEDQPTVAALLEQARETTLAAFAHQELPFEQVVEAVQPQRSLSHSPLFQTLFAFNNTSASGEGVLALPGLTLAPVKSTDDRAHFDLSLSMADRDGHLAGALEYASDLFDRATIERWAGYFVKLLEAMASDASMAVDTLPLLPAAERQQLLHEFNATESAYANDMLLHELFEQQAATQPDAVAVVFEEQRLTYGELNARANRLAHTLIELGIQPDDRVAIAVERGPDLAVGFLGILKAGGAYLPLDPSYPAERLQYTLQDAAPKALLTQRALLQQLPAVAVPVFLLDNDELLSAQPAANPRAQVSPNHVAYVIYTSGSTGLPKGVMVEHGGLSNLAHAQSELFGVDGRSRVLQFASAAFDASVWEMAMTLPRGAALCMAPRNALMPGEPLQTTLRDLAITHATLPSAAVSAFSAVELPALQSLIVAGDVCPPALVERWHDKLQFVNAYGPTETTVCATAQICREPYRVTVPIGRPIANMRVYVLDEHREPVPAGVEGEIYIGGAGVARGYLNRPELTAERFLADPFRTEADARMYKTGDVGRWLPDGTVEYLGRNDFQVKIRGFRIELGEIEAKLSACEGVREAAVIAREDTPGDKRLVAYLVADEGATLQAAELRAALSAQLPEYMLPSAFVLLESLPLNANGKVDRKQLTAPDAAAMSVREYEAPQGEIEATLAALWQDLLHVERVGRRDHFFELGGHSLLVVTMVERLRALGLSGDVRAVFMAPALCDYAATLQVDLAAAGDEIPPNPLTPETSAITPELLPLVTLTQSEIDRIVAAVPGGVGNIQDIYPLLPLQEGMLFHHLLETEGDTYLSRNVIAFDSRERLNAFLSVLERLIARHDILRTAVQWEGLPMPVQVVYRQASLPVDLVALPAEGDAFGALLECTDPKGLRLDLRRAPLMAAYVAEDAARGEWLLSLLSHHMVCDHATLELVMAEVRAMLDGRGQQLEPPLPLRNLVAQAGNVPAAGHEAYFREQLADIDAPTAPFGILDVQVQRSQLETARMRLDGDLARRLRDSAAQAGVPPSVLFHVAWAQVLARCTGRSEVVFGTVLSGRLQGAAGADRALGMFINTLPLRVSLEGDARQVAQQSYERMVTLLAHEQAPLSIAQRCSGVPAHLPLFTTLLNYRHSVDAAATTDSEIEGIRLLSIHEATNYPISVSVDDYGSSFAVSAECAGSIDPDRILSYLLTAVTGFGDALTATAAKSLSQIGILPADERTKLLYGFNATDVDYPSDASIHELFEQQAAAQPDAAAVVFEDQRVTYGELNARANQLAHHLIALGVLPEDRVAICMERSLDMVIGLLGILKAGGVYLPLDPVHPAERVQYMLHDGAPKALLTQHAFVERLPQAELPTLVLDRAEDREALSARPIHNSDLQTFGLTSRNLAYVMYTSGSTGMPKGVMVDHRCVTRLVINNPYFEATPEDCFAHCANPAFDAATWEIWGALLNGARLLVVPSSVVMDPAELNATLYAGGVTALWLTVGLFNQYVNSLPDAFGQLRYLLVGGDALDPKTIRQLLQSEQRPVHVVNGYGPTETTTFACTHDIRAVADDARSIPLGKPIANTQIYILDAYGEPVPVGVEGEIYIGGDGVARGYLNRPELTSERFLRDPFNAGDGARMYKTGDRGRWLADGTIEFLGRDDFQVKIRGFRIELGEIEAQLGQCAGVREAVVIAREDAPGDKRLVAYLVADEGTELSAAGLRDELSRQLPEYMLPAAFVQLDALPLTANGKLDRQALPAPEATALQVREYEAPQGELEEAVAAIWQELLKVPRVGRHDNFFQLGGHSLLAVRIMAAINAQFGLQVTIRDVFESTTVVALAKCLEQHQQLSALHSDLTRVDAHGELDRELVEI